MTAAIAFSLALFSHILNHVVIRLQATLYDLENPRMPLINADTGKREREEGPGGEDVSKAGLRAEGNKV